jgi:hypothetical protein
MVTSDYEDIHLHTHTYTYTHTYARTHTQALETMVTSDYEDIHLAACQALFILSTHDDDVRARLASSDILVVGTIQLSRSPSLKLRRAMIQIVAYMCLDHTAVNKVCVTLCVCVCVCVCM